VGPTTSASYKVLSVDGLAYYPKSMYHSFSSVFTHVYEKSDMSKSKNASQRTEILVRMRKFAQAKCVPTYDYMKDGEPVRLSWRSWWGKAKPVRNYELLQFVRGKPLLNGLPTLPPFKCRVTDFRWALEEVREHPTYYGFEIRSLRKQTIQILRRTDGRDRYDCNDQHCWDVRVPTFLKVTVTETGTDCVTWGAFAPSKSTHDVIWFRGYRKRCPCCVPGPQ
jgi:hypothetical protein